MIQAANPMSQYLAHKEEIDGAIKKVLSSGWYVLGKSVDQFEREFAEYVEVKHGIGVGSGTEALHMALIACGVGPGDEVITVSHTAVATASAISLTGAKPVFVDIEPEYFTIDAECVKKAVSQKTKVIVPVHIYGHPVDMDLIMNIAEENELIVIEDCAQAHGAKYKGRKVGSIGDLGCFSFYPTKNLGAIGDGGMVVTDSPDLAKKVRLLREYGWEERYISSGNGWNSRLDELQAAVLSVKLKSLDSDNQNRGRLAGRYLEGLQELPIELPATRGDSTHVYHLFVIRTDDRDALRSHLQKDDVNTSIQYPVPVHLQPYYSCSSANSPLHVTERLAKDILSLPMYPELSSDDLGKVIESIKGFYHG